jgi:hypothetical protein
MFRHDCEGSSFWSPNTSRTARSRSSCGYLPGRVMAPTPHESETPGTPGQFIRHCPVSDEETHLVLLEPRETVNTGDADLAGTVGERLD